MNIILIRPMTPDTSRSGLVSIQYPINIGYLSSYVKKHGIECGVKDYEVEPFSESAFIGFIGQKNPVLIGFSCMTPHITHAAAMAKLAKKYFPNISTVIGGVHATAIPEKTLAEFAQFDIVVMGEGEQTLVELAQKLNTSGFIGNVEGTALRQAGAITVNPPRCMIENLDDIPFPDRDILELRHYKKSHVTRGISRKVVPIAEMLSSRGCPHECIFCASKIVHSRKVRFRSAENIIAEIKILSENYGISHFSFLDDIFTMKMPLMEPVCKYLKSIGATFDCLTRVNDIDEPKMGLLVSCGCKKISFGVESGSTRILKSIKKGITLDDIRTAFRLARKFKLRLIEASFMIGCHPDETIEDIEETRKLIYELRPDILALFITIPYPGTELYTLMKNDGLLQDENWKEFKLFFGKPSWKLKNIPAEKIQTILKETIRRYYFNPRYIISTLLKIRSFGELSYWISTGISLFKIKSSR